MAYLAPKSTSGSRYLAPAVPPDVTLPETEVHIGWTEDDERPLVYVRNGATIAVPPSRTVRFAGENRTVRF